MRRNFMTFFAFVMFNNFIRVDWQLFIWIDHHTKQSGICLEKEQKGNITINQSMSECDRLVKE